MSEDKKVQEFKLFKHTPVLPLRNIVVFPHMVVPLFVGRDKSIAALESVMDKGQELLFISLVGSSLSRICFISVYRLKRLSNITFCSSYSFCNSANVFRKNGNFKLFTHFTFI